MKIKTKTKPTPTKKLKSLKWGDCFYCQEILYIVSKSTKEEPGRKWLNGHNGDEEQDDGVKLIGVFNLYRYEFSWMDETTDVERVDAEITIEE